MKKIFYFAASALMMCSCADSFLSEEPVGEFLPGQVESEELSLIHISEPKRP